MHRGGVTPAPSLFPRDERSRGLENLVGPGVQNSSSRRQMVRRGNGKIGSHNLRPIFSGVSGAAAPQLAFHCQFRVTPSLLDLPASVGRRRAAGCGSIGRSELRTQTSGRGVGGPGGGAREVHGFRAECAVPGSFFPRREGEGGAFLSDPPIFVFRPAATCSDYRPLRSSTLRAPSIY